ncbi:MAG: PAS domain S-box protein [Pseudomonadales bacterium]|nr:PAS domain S-box protein [Pseudomonadales bacterium]
MSFIDQDAIELIKALPEALLITSEQGKIVYVNDALESLTEFSESDLVGKHVSHLMPSGERERLDVVAWFARWADNPDSHQLRYLSLNGVTKSGEELKFRVRVSAFVKEEESFFLVILQDITEEYQSTLDLRHAKLVSNRILAIGEDAVMTIDDEQHVRYWNKKAEEMFGYTTDEIIGKNFELLVPGSYAEKHRKQVSGFAKGTEASKLMGNRSEIKGLHKDGRVIPLEASITKTMVDGQLLISAQIRDITQRKQAEQALREKELRFRAVFENAVEAMALLSADGKILEFNSAAKDLLPNDEDPRGRDFWMLDWWAEPSEEVRLELKENVVRVSRGEVHRARAELPIGDKTHDIDFSLKAVTDSEGQVRYIIAEGRDLTNVGEST